MRTYSKQNLLQKSIEMKTTWLNIVNLSSVVIEFNVPRSTYFRMKVLCEDIHELSGQMFTQQKMIEILWRDFIEVVKMTPNPETIYNLLIERSGTKKVVKEEILQEVNTFSFFEKTYEVKPQTNSNVIHYRMNRKQALRGEVMLADMAEVKPRHELTLEKVLEIIYCDFIEKYKQGESEQVVEQIIAII
ncbi:hypothetical protein RJD24_18465 [Bacillaceae bacterium IKA-2]|nr:hypothetical protein RJD24_18465 [Bacillaceae bacterium IKA-2]